MPVYIDGNHIIIPTSISSTGAGNSSSISAKGAVTFSSCATLSLNGIFSADYDNYIIVMRSVAAAGEVAITARMRSAGTDNSTSNYTLQQIVGNDTAVTGTRLISQTAVAISSTSATSRSGSVTWIYGPFLNQPTSWRFVTARGDSNSTLIDSGCTHSVSSSYDGLTLITSSSTISGLLSVYGMVK